MKKIDPATYDALIRMIAADYFPELCGYLGPFGWLWVKAQIKQESRFNLEATSRAGAMGLMQLMPATAREMGVKDPFSPTQNITGGIKYLAQQYHKLAEIPCHIDRFKFALAAYNGGRGYVNVALALARQAEGLPFGYRGWVKGGRLPGRWQCFDHASRFLADVRCRVRGKRPDYMQMTDYVERIEDYFKEFFAEVTV